jgi:hypothetical protein
MSDPFKDVAAVSEGEPSPEILFWTKEIEFAKKRETDFRRDAERVIKLYEAQKSEANSFNILYANTETLLPATYNKTPRPMVERRFKDADPMGLQAATVLERTLGYLIDSPDAEYESYDALFRQATLAALVPGRGVIWYAYDPKIEGAEAAVGDSEEDEDEGAAAVANQQENTGEVIPQATGKVIWETVCGEMVPYDKFLCGYGHPWKHVPWAAREHAMTKEDAEANFGKEVARDLEYLQDSQDGKKEDQGTDALKNQGSLKTACVYEIWHKQEKQVVFFAPSLKSRLCRTMDDPYGLTGFYPCAEPLQFLKKLSTVVPTPVYLAYEPQAKELNSISRRINRIINAMKVRGFYDGSVQGLKELLSADDNTLIPAKNVAAMKDGAGSNLVNSVWFMPLEMLVGTVKQLYVARQECKSVIYEITGIADIMRGNTQASETATAQNIKDKWGSLRLQNMQGAVQFYIRDCLRIVAELAGNHFDLATFAGMTNLDYATPQDLQRAEQLTAAINAAMMQQPPPQPGAPPPAPPPQLQQAMQEVQAIQAKPKWEPVLALLKDNLQRGYKIDIETNSTLANTSAEDQENITKAMSAIGAALQQFVPALQVGMMTMPAVKEILLSMARRFEFGRQVENAITEMPDQLPPPPPDPRVNADLEKQKQDIAGREAALQKEQLGLQEREAAIELKVQEVSGDIDEAKSKLDIKTKEALSAQEVSQTKFLLEVEKRLSSHEMKMQKGIQQQKMTADKAAASREKAVSAHKEAGDKVIPMIQDLSKAHQDSTQKLVETLTKVLGAPIEMTKDAKTGSKTVRRVLQ